MNNREDGLQEIYERLKANREALGIKTFRWTPTQPATEEELTCIFMSEEKDEILDKSKRNKTGYPARRVLEVVIEIIVLENVDVKSLFRNIRRVIFTERGTSPPVFTPIVAKNTFISENRTEGPTGYGLPGIKGMVLVLDLVYTDNAF